MDTAAGTVTLSRVTFVQIFYKKLAGYSKTAMGRLYFCIVNEDEIQRSLRREKFSLNGKKKSAERAPEF